MCTKGRNKSYNVSKERLLKLLSSNWIRDVHLRGKHKHATIRTRYEFPLAMMVIPVNTFF